jgi:hypothetical protein
MAYTAAIIDAYVHRSPYITIRGKWIYMSASFCSILSKIIEVILARSLDLQAEEAKIF